MIFSKFHFYSNLTLVLKIHRKKFNNDSVRILLNICGLKIKSGGEVARNI